MAYMSSYRSYVLTMGLRIMEENGVSLKSFADAYLKNEVFLIELLKRYDYFVPHLKLQNDSN